VNGETRMALFRSPAPKLILTGREASNERLVQEIPLTDEERAAVDGDTEAVNRLIDVLAPIPAPDGQLRSAEGSPVKSS